MKWNQRQKIGGAVLVLAVGVFVADRWSSSSPVEAPEANIVSFAEPARISKLLEASQQSATTTALAQRLERVAGEEFIVAGRSADAFSPPASWFGPKAVVGRPAGSDRAADFKAKYKLSAVMKGSSAGTGVAVLVGPAGGLTVRAGQSIDGYVLRSVRESAVVLDDGRGPVELRLERTGFGATATITP